jgi:hypothetical protein
VLIEAKLTPRTEDPAKLGERLALVRHRAQHSADHDYVYRARLQLERGRQSGHYSHGYRSIERGLLRLATKVPLGLDSDELDHARRVVLEVDAVAGAHLNHTSARPRQEFPP